MYTSYEICAGAGGQALGLELAGFTHIKLVEYEEDYCACLKTNRPEWNIECNDVRNVVGTAYKGKVDLLAGGVPCPPFSKAGKQLGAEDERDLFPEIIRLAGEIRPKAIMIENVRGLLDSKFDSYRLSILEKLGQLGYNTHIRLLHASDYGVSQLRPRVVIVGIRTDLYDNFIFPPTNMTDPPSIGELLYDLMSENGWKGVNEWKEKGVNVKKGLLKTWQG